MMGKHCANLSFFRVQTVPLSEVSSTTSWHCVWGSRVASQRQVGISSLPWWSQVKVETKGTRPWHWPTWAAWPWMWVHPGLQNDSSSGQRLTAESFSHGRSSHLKVFLLLIMALPGPCSFSWSCGKVLRMRNMFRPTSGSDVATNKGEGDMRSGPALKWGC